MIKIIIGKVEDFFGDYVFPIFMIILTVLVMLGLSISTVLLILAMVMQ